MKNATNGTNVTTDEKTLDFAPGYILINCSHARGGVKYEHDDLNLVVDGDGEEKTWRTVRKVDHVELVKAIDAFVKKPIVVLTRHAAQIGLLGWFADKAGYKQLVKEIAALQQELDALNAVAEQNGCARRGTITVVPFKLDLNNQAAAAEIAATVRGALGDLQAALRRGEIDVDPLVRRCKNLHLLAPGMQGDLIKFALDAARAGRTELKKRIALGDDPAVIGAGLALAAMDHALALFTPYGMAVSGAATGAEARS